jgi:hypothetical protein
MNKRKNRGVKLSKLYGSFKIFINKYECIFLVKTKEFIPMQLKSYKITD